MLGTIEDFQSLATSHRTLHAQCFEGGFNVNKTPESLVGVVDFTGQRLKQVGFRPPNSHEIKGIS